MSLDKLVQSLPKPSVAQLTTTSPSPACLTPDGQVSSQPINDIPRIAEKVDFTGFVQCLKPANNRGQFHPVVRCPGMAVFADYLLPCLIICEAERPAADAAGRLAGAVGDERDG